MSVETTPNADADKAFLVVRNDFDQVVSRSQLGDAQASSASWNGLDDMGKMVPEGSYKFSIESFEGDMLLGTEPGQVFSRVSEVRLSGGEPVLVLDGGAEVAIDEVTALR